MTALVANLPIKRTLNGQIKLIENVNKEKEEEKSEELEG